MKQIYISDYTLKKLAGERNNPLLFREKTNIASSIDSFGVDAIELAPVNNVKEDTIINKTISASVKNACVCIPIGFSADSVEVAWNCISEAVKPCLQVVLPLSTVQMEYTYHMKAAKMSAKIEELCTLAKAKCATVDFVAVDASRAEKDFLISACKLAEKAGVTSITLCDDAGILLPDEFSDLVSMVKSEVSIPVYVMVSDNLNMAVATAVAAVKAGADGVKTVVTGTNALRADKFSFALTSKEDVLGICTTLDITKLHSDIHSLAKKINSTENTVSETVDGSKENIFLDSESSLEQINDAANILGYNLSEEDIGKVQKALYRVCAKKSSVGSKELEALIAANAMQVPSTYHLESYSISSSNMTPAMATVTLIKGMETISGVATGDGPIDAAFLAIEQSIGFHYELDEFQIQAVTEGKEALGSALVRLRANGGLYSGNGLSTDIVAASIRAYINALNKIVYEEA